MGKDGREGEIEGGFVGNFFASLPEGFVANALALTSPRDVCRLSLVSKVFRSAAEWDAVWESFLPQDYKEILAEAEEGGRAIRFGSKKELYMRLCDHPVIIDGGNKSFSLEKSSGKRCYMLGALDLSIIWGSTPRYWRWISVQESRFAKVAELIDVCWLEVHGSISTSMLSTNTRYVAYLVCKLSSRAYGFVDQLVDVSVGIGGVESQTRTVILDPKSWLRQRDQHAIPGGHAIPRGLMGIPNRVRRPANHATAAAPLNENGPKHRQDGWLEIELGEYFNEEGEGGELKMSMLEVKGGHWKSGLTIQGIEIRPKAC